MSLGTPGGTPTDTTEPFGSYWTDESNAIFMGSQNLIKDSKKSSIIAGSFNNVSGVYGCHVLGDYIGAEFTDGIPFPPKSRTFHVACSNGLLCYGDVVSFAASDERLKDNVSPIEDPLNKVTSLDAVQFDWNSNQQTHSGHDIGLIAQQVESIAPEIVSERMDGYKGVKYEKIVPLLVGAIKEQQERIKELERKLERVLFCCDPTPLGGSPPTGVNLDDAGTYDPCDFNLND